MRKFLKFLESSTGSRSARVWVGLLCVLALILGTTAANAASSVPPVILSQVTWLNTTQGGGIFTNGDPAGTSFAVNQNGDVILANTNAVFLFNGQTGAATNLGTWTNVLPVTVDSQNNLYVANLYGTTIVKLPFVNGAYAAFNNNPSSGCTGNDTVACWLPGTTLGANAYYYKPSAIAFDAQGDYFWVQQSGNNNTSNSIWECSATCLYGSGASAQMIYQEPTTTPAPSGTGTGQLTIGGLAIDPWGNLFFTDSSIYIANGYQIISYVSNLNEIPTSAGAGFGGATTGYAAAPTVLYSETPGTPGPFDNELTSVVIDTNGTVYFADLNDVYAFPNTGGTIPLTAGQPTDLYAVSPEGAKALALDGKGNLFFTVYSSAINSGGTDTLGKISLGSLAAPNTATGTQFSVANISAVVNDGAATPALTFTVSSGGQVIPSGITATAGTGAALGSSTVFPVTLQAKPGNVGLQSAVLTATETEKSTSGSANIYVVGQGPMVTVDPGSWNAYTTGFSAPYSVSVDQGGDLAVADETAGKVFELANGTSTWVSIGSGFAAPAATAFDTNSNLYIADFTNNNIVEIPNTSTTGGFTAGTQTTVVSSSVTFGGTALSKPSGLTVGPDGVLYIADLGNKRVVTYNPFSGDTAVRVTGLTNPWGLAVDGAGNLYIANTGGGDVLEYSGGGVVTTLTPAGVTKPWGVVVDPSGSVIISDKATGNIVLVPNEAGTLTDADAITIEKNPSSGYGLAMDNNGNLFTTDSVGKAVYAIWRNQPSLTFGSTNDGTTSAAQTLYVESAGNTALTLGTPFATGLVGPFTEAAGGTNPCADGATTPVGLYCELSAAFAPTGSESGMQAGSFTLNSNAVKEATLTASLSGTAVSTLLGQTINFTPPATPVTFGASAVTLVATGGASGNPVTFSLDAASTVGAGSLSGTNNDTLTFTGVGTIVIDANQAGNASYAAATQVQQTVVVQAATLPIPPAADIILSQITWLSKINGNAFSSSNPAGGSFAVNSNGDAVVANTKILELINGETGVITNLGSLSSGGAVTIDSNNNIYLGDLYNMSALVELPYTGASTNGGYAAFTTDPASSTPPACGATPTTECSITGVGSFYPGAIAFDKNGNLFWATSGNGATSGNSIYECTVACLGGTGSPVQIYQEPTAASAPSATSGQLLVGSLAIDPWGNLFFTDSSIYVSPGYQNTSFFANLNELPVSAGAGYNGVTTGFAASPTVLYTITPSSPGPYDNELDAVAIDAKTGTVYFADQNHGIFAFANDGSALTEAALAPKIYTVSVQGAKVLTLDSKSNLYFEVYSNSTSGDTLGFATINNVTVPQTTLNTASNATITAILNDQSCSDPVVTINSSSAAFTATATWHLRGYTDRRRFDTWNGDIHANRIHTHHANRNADCHGQCWKHRNRNRDRHTFPADGADHQLHGADSDLLHSRRVTDYGHRNFDLQPDGYAHS